MAGRTVRSSTFQSRVKAPYRWRANYAAASLALATAVIPAPAFAFCPAPKTPDERSLFADRVIAGADAIFLGSVRQRYDASLGRPEVLKVERTLKGRAEGQWRLWLPRENDELTTVEAPTAGLRVGGTALFALRRTSKGLVIFECDARTIFDPAIRNIVLRKLDR